MYDPLGKNLLLPSWYVKDFKEESSASLLGIVFLNLCDLSEMVLGCTCFIGGKSLLLPLLLTRESLVNLCLLRQS